MSRRVGAAAAALGALLALSAYLRTRALDSPYWIDEGIAVGIASHAAADIPGVLRQDGSPPLYYLLLHAWTGLAGAGEAETHALSLMAALAAVPVALWAGARLFGRGAGLACAAIVAVNPFLTLYAGETRMYALAMALSLVVAACTAGALAEGSRAWAAGLGVSLAALLYVHTWALYVAAGIAVAAAVRLRHGDRRPSAAAAGGLAIALLAFAPWLPTLAFQAAHTGAPWSETPGPAALAAGVWMPLGGEAADVMPIAGSVATALVLAAAAVGLLRGARATRGPSPATVEALAVSAGAALLLAWLASQVSPHWANRYLAVLFGHAVLLAAAGIARAGVPGAVALAAAAALFCAYRPPEPKSNVAAVAAGLSPGLRAGDVVVSAQPEQVPVLHHYLRDDLRFVTPAGAAADPRVMDWRDALDRLRRARPAADARALVTATRPGRHVVLVLPVARGASWQRPWTAAVSDAADAWRAALDADRRLVAVADVPASPAENVAVSARVYRVVALPAADRAGG